MSHGGVNICIAVKNSRCACEASIVLSGALHARVRSGEGRSAGSVHRSSMRRIDPSLRSEGLWLFDGPKSLELA
jgi:hypothetical protein